MPELKALGVEWKGESAHENTGGLDFWQSLAPGCQCTHLCILCLLQYIPSVQEHLMFFVSLVLVSGESVVDLLYMDTTFRICKSSAGTLLACFIVDLGVAVRETPYTPSCDVYFTKSVGCFLHNDVLTTSLDVSFL